MIERRDFAGAGLAILILAACSGGTGPTVRVPPPPSTDIALNPLGVAWWAQPIAEALDSVSNDGANYTGEFDRYRVASPITGRMQVALTWDHQSDFDLILASDPEGTNRLAEGLLNDAQPEYVGIEVNEGQVVYLFVVGWEGDPGEYLLEVVALPPGEPVFDLESLPDITVERARNLPLVFTFNVDLNPDQDFDRALVLVSPGLSARGTWCAVGPLLVFLPDLPERPGDDVGLREGETYTFQFRSGGKGLRAITGEYLSTLVTGEMQVAGFEDEDPTAPPRVISFDWDPATPWDGTPISFVVRGGALDPTTVAAEIRVIDPTTGNETPLPTKVSLSQFQDCDGLEVAIVVEPEGALPSQAQLRIRIPGTVVGITGDPVSENGLTGPAPAPGGQGVALDFTTP